MGDVSGVLITGANGFIGRAAVTVARAHGLDVVAIYRSAPCADWADDDGIVPLRVDLSESGARERLSRALDSVEAVIHAAGHLGGDAAAHGRDTLRSTETLLTAMSGKAIRLVHVSSISVYDFMVLSNGDTVDENSPLEAVDTARDAYTKAKLQQEALVRAAGIPTWLMRPGAVYGRGRTWHHLPGFFVSGLFVCVEGGGDMPQTHVDHTADALIAAARADPGGTRALNVLDDDLPTRRRFVAEHRRLTGRPRAVIPLSYGSSRAVARALSPGGYRLSSLLREPVLRARLMPLRWPNTALRQALGGADRAPFPDMLRDALAQAAP